MGKFMRSITSLIFEEMRKKKILKTNNRLFTKLLNIRNNFKIRLKI